MNNRIDSRNGNYNRKFSGLSVIKAYARRTEDNGLRCDGKKEIMDFRLSGRESAVEWELFLNDLCRRG